MWDDSKIDGLMRSGERQGATDYRSSEELGWFGVLVGLGIFGGWFWLTLHNYEPLFALGRMLFTTYRYVIFIAGVALSAALFAFKKHSQSAYGLVELATAIAALAVFVSGPPPKGIDWAVKFLAPIYIAIRGLTNIDEGERKKHALASAARAKAATAPTS